MESKSQQMNFIELPNDIHDSVFSWLCDEDLVNLLTNQLTNHILRSLLEFRKQKKILKYLDDFIYHDVIKYDNDTLLSLMDPFEFLSMMYIEYEEEEKLPVSYVLYENLLSDDTINTLRMFLYTTPADKILDVLLRDNSGDCNSINKSIEMNSPRITNLLVEFCPKDKRVDLLSARNEYEINTLTYLINKYNNLHLVKTLIESCDPIKVIDLLSMEDSSGCTILHLLVLHATHRNTILEKKSEDDKLRIDMLKFILDFFPEDKLYNFISHTNVTDDNILSLSVEKEYIQYIEYILDILDNEQLFKLFNIKNKRSENILTQAIAIGNTYIISMILSKCNKDEAFYLLNQSNNL